MEVNESELLWLSIEREKAQSKLQISSDLSEKQARYMRDKIEERLKQYKLELNQEKTKIVYAGRSNDHDDRGHKLPRKFTFLLRQ